MLKLTIPENRYANDTNLVYRRMGWDVGAEDTLASVARQVEDWVSNHGGSQGRLVCMSIEERQELLDALREAQK